MKFLNSDELLLVNGGNTYSCICYPYGEKGGFTMFAALGGRDHESSFPVSNIDECVTKCKKDMCNIDPNHGWFGQVTTINDEGGTIGGTGYHGDCTV
jgi:hypothetical protein